MTAMSPCCAELYACLRTTMASTNGSPLRARSAASCKSSARIDSCLLDPGAGPLEVFGNVQIGERGGRPRQVGGLAPVPLHHLLAAPVARERAKLLEQGAPVEDGRSHHAVVRRDDERGSAAMPREELGDHQIGRAHV